MPRHRPSCELSIVMPCLNEAETLAVCIRKAKSFIAKNNVAAEIIVADNGSTDGSGKIAKDLGVVVVNVAEKGYGSALIGGVNAAGGKYIIMADADDSYDFADLMPFLKKLREGYGLVMGNRFTGGIEKGAMPLLHRYVGNPILSGIGKLFFKCQIRDFHCGLRGFTKSAYKRMDLQTTGMEFASEMVVKAILYNIKITEVPTKLSPDGRSGKPHLRSFRDGWRHLRFLLLYSPRWLFLYPGLMMMMIGLLSGGFILFQPDINWDIHSLLYSSASILIGFQAVIFAIFTKTFAVHEKLIPNNPQIELILGKLSLEKGLLAGFVLILAGIAAFVYAVVIWRQGEFFEVGITITMRIVITSVTLLILGFQLVFSSFFFNVLQLNTK